MREGRKKSCQNRKEGRKEKWKTCDMEAEGGHRLAVGGVAGGAWQAVREGDG